MSRQDKPVSLVDSIRLQGPHATLSVFNRGGHAGFLTILKGDLSFFDRVLDPEGQEVLVLSSQQIELIHRLIEYKLDGIASFLAFEGASPEFKEECKEERSRLQDLAQTIDMQLEGIE